MVHAKAQNILASVYAGRLTDSNNIIGSADASSMSGYSDTFALNPMQADQPGKKATIPGFEMVPENRLDFAYYKGRHEFADEHGGSGGIYGKAEDIIRSDTPGASSAYSTDSRPGTPSRTPPPFAPGIVPVRNYSGVSYDAQGDMGYGHNHTPGYGPIHTSETSNLVHGAAGIGLSTPPVTHGRDISGEHRAPGFLGGGPQGYGGLPQSEIEDDGDPTSYDYFRTRRQNGWSGAI